MKLLLDQNLSFKLVQRLDDLYPDSQHVRLVGLDQVDDEKVWDYARQHSYVLVTQDIDFSNLADLRGYPPKVIWFRCGNQPSAVIENLLRKNHTKIAEWINDPMTACLEIY